MLSYESCKAMGSLSFHCYVPLGCLLTHVNYLGQNQILKTYNFVFFHMYSNHNNKMINVTCECDSEFLK